MNEPAHRDAERKLWQSVDVQPDEKTIDAVVSPRNNNWFLIVLAARRALTFLQQRPEVDPERLGVTGHSMGGTVSMMAAATLPAQTRGLLLLEPVMVPPAIGWLLAVRIVGDDEQCEHERRVLIVANFPSRVAGLLLGLYLPCRPLVVMPPGAAHGLVERISTRRRTYGQCTVAVAERFPARH